MSGPLSEYASDGFENEALALQFLGFSDVESALLDPRRRNIFCDILGLNDFQMRLAVAFDRLVLQKQLGDGYRVTSRGIILLEMISPSKENRESNRAALGMSKLDDRVGFKGQLLGLVLYSGWLGVTPWENARKLAADGREVHSSRTDPFVFVSDDDFRSMGCEEFKCR